MPSFCQVIFVELDRAESQRCLDGMKRALTSESHNFMSHSQASPAPPHILPSRNQGAFPYLSGLTD